MDSVLLPIILVAGVAACVWMAAAYRRRHNYPPDKISIAKGSEDLNGQQPINSDNAELKAHVRKPFLPGAIELPTKNLTHEIPVTPGLEVSQEDLNVFQIVP